MKLSEKNQAEYEELGLPINKTHLCALVKSYLESFSANDDETMEFQVRAANAHHALVEENERLRELLKTSAETIAELRGGEDCDHSIGVCWCGVTRLQEEVEEALKGETK